MDAVNDPGDKRVYGLDDSAEGSRAISKSNDEEEWVPARQRKRKANEEGKGTYLPRIISFVPKRWMLSGRPKTCQKGPDISKKAPRSQWRYMKAVATQGNLDSFLSRPGAPSSSPIYVASRSQSPAGLGSDPSVSSRYESNSAPLLVPEDGNSGSKEGVLRAQYPYIHAG